MTTPLLPPANPWPPVAGNVYTVGSLFSGIGGLDLAAQWAGFETAWFVEKEPFPQRVLKKHWPGVPIYGDIFECHDLPYVDVIVGGFPCQPFSVAGKRQGADDERFLLPEMLRIIREVKPYAVLFENVPGFPSLNDGSEFKYLLRALAEMGFNAEWGHLRASDCGAPHQRERWFCVAYRGVGLADTSRSRRQPITRSLSSEIWQQENIIPSGISKVRELAYALRQRRPRRKVHISHISQIPARGKTDTPFASWTACESNGVGLADTESADARGFYSQGRTPSQPGISHGRSGKRHVEHTDHKRRSQRQLAIIANRTAQYSRRFDSESNLRKSQSLVGGNTHGLSSGLDFVGWPARPGETQHDYEPPRVTFGRTPNRAARLKALGNSVVPQVVYPLLVAIREWIEETMFAAASERSA